MTVVYTPASLITLDEAKAHLRITSNTTDDELGLYLASVTQVIEERVGPVVPRQFTQVVDMAETIVLDKAPVISVDSTVQTFPNLGALFAVPTYQLEEQTGLLRLVPLYAFNGPSWAQSYHYGVRLTVTYTAGRSPVPAAIQLAARIILEELWSARRAAGPLPARGVDSGQVGVPGGYGLPDSAVELLRPFTRSTRVG